MQRLAIWPTKNKIVFGLRVLQFPDLQHGDQWRRQWQRSIAETRLRLVKFRPHAAFRPDTVPDLIVAGLGRHGTAVLEVKGLRRRFPGIAIVITGGKLSREISAQFYRAGTTANSSTGCPRRCDHQSGTSVRGRKAERGACSRSNNGRRISRPGHRPARLLCGGARSWHFCSRASCDVSIGCPSGRTLGR